MEFSAFARSISCEIIMSAITVFDTGSLLAQIAAMKKEISELREELAKMELNNESDLTKSIILEKRKTKLEEEKTTLESYISGFCVIL